MAVEKRKSRRLTAADFNTLMAPVFTCFKNDDDCTLELQFVDRYARWLKLEGIKGVMVNGITGEGPALALNERKLNAEAWSKVVVKHDLMFLVQVGGTSLPDVVHLAQHAESIGAQAVVCLPELYNKPRSIRQLLTYCKIIAKKCDKLPFLYYHAPEYTGINFDMREFCDRAQIEIPNFLGLQFTSSDLAMGADCLRKDRVVMLGIETFLASAMLVGCESGMFGFINGCPKLFWSIYNAIKTKNLPLARKQQQEVVDMVKQVLANEPLLRRVPLIKAWFNRMMSGTDGAGFSAGPARKHF